MSSTTTAEMRILVLHQFYTTDAEAGISRFNVFAKYWRARGAKVTVISGSLNYITGKRSRTHGLFTRERDEASGADVIRVFSTAFGYRTFIGRMISYFSFFFSALVAAAFAPRTDIVIASSPPILIGFLGWCVAALRRAPFVFEVRDLWPDEIVELGYIKNKLLIGASHLLERFLYARPRGIIVNSPGLKELLVERKNVPAEKIGVVVNPAEAGREDKAGGSDIAWGEKNVLYIGAHSFVYDFDIMLDAAKNLPDLTFILVGDGRRKPEVLRRVKEERLQNVHCYSSVPRAAVAGIIHRADIGIVPLGGMRFLNYIYASKTFDYMAGGKPVVLVGGGVNAKLVIEDARCGVCVPPGKGDELQRVIVSLFTDQEGARAMGERGRRYLREHFSPEDLSEKYLGFLEPLVVPKRKRH